MELFARFDMLTEKINEMNREAVTSSLPYLRLHEYTHYCDLKTFFHNYTRPLRLKREESDALFLFIWKDTLNLRGVIGEMDFYLFTFRYFKSMLYRTGNLDTPDDCVEKLDLDLFIPYKEAREREWLGRADAEDLALLERSVQLMLHPEK